MSVKNKEVAKGYRVKVEERTEIQKERSPTFGVAFCLREFVSFRETDRTKAMKAGLPSLGSLSIPGWETKTRRGTTLGKRASQMSTSPGTNYSSITSHLGN